MLVKNIKSASSKKKGTSKNKKKETKREQVKMGFEMPDDDEFEEEVMRQLQEEEARRKGEQKIKLAKKQNTTKNELKPLQIEDMSQFEQELRTKEEELKMKQIEKEKKLEERQKLSQTANPLVIGINEIVSAQQQSGSMVENKSDIANEAQQRVGQGEDSVVRISECPTKINKQEAYRNQQTKEQQRIEQESEQITMREKYQHGPALQMEVVLPVQKGNDSDKQIQIELDNDNEQIKLLESGFQHHLNEENLKYDTQKEQVEWPSRVGEKEQKIGQNSIEQNTNSNIKAESLQVLEVSSPQLQQLIHDDNSKVSGSNNQSQKRSSPQVSDSYIPLNQQRQQREIKEQGALQNKATISQLLNNEQIQEVGIQEQTQAQELIQQPLISIEPQTLLKQQQSIQHHQQELAQNQKQQSFQYQSQQHQEYKSLTQEQQQASNKKQTDSAQQPTVNQEDYTKEHNQLQNNEAVEPLKGQQQLQDQKQEIKNQQNIIEQQINAQQPKQVITENNQPRSQHNQKLCQQHQYQTHCDQQLSHNKTYPEQQPISSQIKSSSLLQEQNQLQDQSRAQLNVQEKCEEQSIYENINDRPQQNTNEGEMNAESAWKQVQVSEKQTLDTINKTQAQNKGQVHPANSAPIHLQSQTQRLPSDQSPVSQTQKVPEPIQCPTQLIQQTEDRQIVYNETNEIKPQKPEAKSKRSEGNNKAVKSKTSKKAKPKSTLKLIQSNMFEEQEQMLESYKQEDPLLYNPSVNAYNQVKKQLIQQESKEVHTILQVRPQVAQQMVKNNEGSQNKCIEGHQNNKNESLTMNVQQYDSQQCKYPEQPLSQEIPSNGYADQSQKMSSSGQNVIMVSSNPSNQSSQKLSPSLAYPAQPAYEQQEQEQGLSLKSSMKPKQSKKGGKKGSKSTKKPTNTKKSIISSGNVFEELQLETIEQKNSIDHPGQTQKSHTERKQQNRNRTKGEVINQANEITPVEELSIKQSLQQKQLSSQQIQRQEKEEEQVANLSLVQQIQQQQLGSKSQQKIGKLTSNEIFSDIPQPQPVSKTQQQPQSHSQANQTHPDDNRTDSNEAETIDVKDPQVNSLSQQSENLQNTDNHLQEAQETVIVSNVAKKKKKTLGNGTKKKPLTSKAKTTSNMSKLSNIPMDIDQFVVEEEQLPQIIDHPTLSQPVKNDIEENQEQGKSENNQLPLQKPQQHEPIEEKQVKTISEQKQITPHTFPVNQNLREESKYQQKIESNEEKSQSKSELQLIQTPQQPKPLEQGQKNAMNAKVFKDQEQQHRPQHSSSNNQQRQEQLLQIKQVEMAKISLKGNTSKPAKKGSKKKPQSTKKSSKNKSVILLDFQEVIQQQEQSLIEQKIVPQTIKESVTASKESKEQQNEYNLSQKDRNNSPSSQLVEDRKEEPKESQNPSLNINQDHNLNAKFSQITNGNEEYQDIREPQQRNVQPTSLQQEQTKQTNHQSPINQGEEPNPTLQSLQQSPKNLLQQQNASFPQSSQEENTEQSQTMEESKVELDLQLSIPTISKPASTLKKPLKKSSQATKKSTKPTASKQKQSSLIMSDIQQMIEEKEETHHAIEKTEIQRQQRRQTIPKQSQSTDQIKTDPSSQSQNFSINQTIFEQIPIIETSTQKNRQISQIDEEIKQKEEIIVTNPNLEARSISEQIGNAQLNSQIVEVQQQSVKPQLESEQTKQAKPLEQLQSKQSEEGLNAKSQIQQPNESELTFVEFEISKNKKKKPLTKVTKTSRNKQSSKPITKVQTLQTSKQTNFSQSSSLPTQFPQSLQTSSPHQQQTKLVEKEQPKDAPREVLEKPNVSKMPKPNKSKSKIIDFAVQETELSPETNTKEPARPNNIELASNKSSQPLPQVPEKNLYQNSQQTCQNKPQSNIIKLMAAPQVTQKPSSKHTAQKDKQSKSSKSDLNAKLQPNQNYIPKASQSQQRSLPVPQQNQWHNKVNPQQKALQSLLKSQLEMVRLNNDSNLQIIRQKIRQMKQALNDKLRRKLQRTHELQKLQSKNPAQQKPEDEEDDHNYGEQSVLRENIILKKQLYQRTSAQ